MHSAETILFLAVLGTVVAAFAGWLRVPASSLLVIAGLAVGPAVGGPGRPTHQLVRMRAVAAGGS